MRAQRYDFVWKIGQRTSAHILLPSHPHVSACLLAPGVLDCLVEYGRLENVFRPFRISRHGFHKHHEIDRHVCDLPIAIHPSFIGDDGSMAFYTFQIIFTVKNYNFQIKCDIVFAKKLY